MDNRLGIVDRTTLVAWRGLNLVGWSALGSFLALELHWLMVQMLGFRATARYTLRYFDPSTAATVRMIAFRAGLAIVSGWIIGAIVRRRVFRSHALAAATAAAAYVVFIAITLEYSFQASARVLGAGLPYEGHFMMRNSFIEQAVHSIAILATIPIAIVAARRQATGRPSS